MEGEGQTRLVRFVEEMIDAIGVEERRPTLDAVDGIAFAEQEFGKMIAERIKPASIEVADGARSTRTANRKRKPARRTVRHEA